MSLSLYLNLLKTQEPVPVAVQQAACAAALKNKSSDADAVLAALAVRTDLDPAVGEKVAKCSRAKVRAAWLSRPGFTHDEIVTQLRAESRASVLAAVASSSETSAELLEALADDGRPMVCEAVLQNPNATASALAKALVAVGEKPRSYAVSHLISSVMENHPDLLEDLAQNCGPVLARRLLSRSSELGEASMRRLLKLLVADPLRAIAPSVIARPNSLAVARWSREPARVELEKAFEALEELSCSGFLTLKDCESFKEPWGAMDAVIAANKIEITFRGEFVPIVLRALVGDEDARGAFDERDKRREQIRIEAASADDDKVLSEMVYVVLNQNHDSHIAATLEGLVQNPHLAGQHISEFNVRYGSGAHGRRLVATALANLGSGVDPALAAIIANVVFTAVSYGGASVTEDPLWTALVNDEMRELVLEGLAAHAVDSVWRMDCVLNVEGMHSRIAKKIKAEHFTGYNAGAHLETLLPLLNVELASILGDDTKAWESFTMLASELKQPLVEVATTAKRLGA